MDITLIYRFIHSCIQVNKYGFIAYFIKRMGHRTVRFHASYKMTHFLFFSLLYTVLLRMDICSVFYTLPSFCSLLFPQFQWFDSYGHCYVLTWIDCSRGRPIRDFPRFFLLEVRKSVRLCLVVGGTICNNSWRSWWPGGTGWSVGKKIMQSGRESSEKAMKKVLAFRLQVLDDLVLQIHTFAAVCPTFPSIRGNNLVSLINSPIS